MSLTAQLRAVAELLAAHHDVLSARPADGSASPSVERGWSEPLLALSDEALAAIEEHGVDGPWPPQLSVLVAAVRTTTALSPLATAGTSAPMMRNVNARKAKQIDAFMRALPPLLAGAQRVVDVGSGHGHLTREIAARTTVPVVGLERNPALAARAQALAGERATFEIVDALAGASFMRGDLVVGLHACGELGDAIVARAGDAHAVALVGCCLQKRRAMTRPPLISFGSMDVEVTFSRDVLGLSNLTPRALGVEATREENVAARERRLALRKLLTDVTGASLRAGEEIAGLNRRSAHAPLADLVARAFSVRKLTQPSAAAVREAAAWARDAHAHARRLALPRTILARALEVFVALDRAVLLEARGLAVDVGTLFPPDVSARNIAIVGVRR